MSSRYRPPFLIALFLACVPASARDVPSLLSAAQNSDQSQVSHRWTVHGKQLAFSGMILPGDCARFRSIAPPGAFRMSVNSGGGDAFEGLCIGEEMSSHEVDLEVHGVCVSSCANYLFTAARRKRIDGIVGFHGDLTALLASFAEDERAMREDLRAHGISRGKIDESVASWRERLSKESARERGFLSRIGVSQRLFDQSQRPDKGNGGGSFDFLLPSPETFTRYGIRGVDGHQDVPLGESFHLKNLFF